MSDRIRTILVHMGCPDYMIDSITLDIMNTTTVTSDEIIKYLQERERCSTNYMNLKSSQRYDTVHTRFITSSCPICLDDYETSDEVTLLTCQHVIHSRCVSKCYDSLCPLCRTQIKNKIDLIP